jgi:hypothetical protein
LQAWPNDMALAKRAIRADLDAGETPVEMHQ